MAHWLMKSEPSECSIDDLAAHGAPDKNALRELPPLIKGYLRLSGYVGDGAVIDHEFGSVDVSIVVVTAEVTDKYMKHYTRPDYGSDS